MAAGDANTTESSLIFGFLVAFLASFALSITGGIVWPRIRLILAERYGLFPIEPPHNVIVPSAVPELWDVCVRGVVRGAKVSDCGWEHLRASTPSLLSRASTRNHRRKRRTAVGTPCQSRVRPPFRARWKLWMREEEAEDTGYRISRCAFPGLAHPNVARVRHILTPNDLASQLAVSGTSVGRTNDTPRCVLGTQSAQNTHSLAVRVPTPQNCKWGWNEQDGWLSKQASTNEWFLFGFRAFSQSYQIVGSGRPRECAALASIVLQRGHSPTALFRKR
ncbi:hypothetical protein C8Q76DRAFT_795244 [Earliella scabrosa]|nr:hypothetical protein C8Q76DRAFT_795244 [Earliella scabrosa]